MIPKLVAVRCRSSLLRERILVCRPFYFVRFHFNKSFLWIGTGDKAGLPEKERVLLLGPVDTPSPEERARVLEKTMQNVLC